jgi:hypothetical protein
VPGRTAYTLTGLDDLLTDTQVIGDLGYPGTPVIRPRRKRPRHTKHTPEDARVEPEHQQDPLGRRTRHVRREALCCIPGSAGRDLEGGSWVEWLTWIRKVKGTRACQESR